MRYFTMLWLALIHLSGAAHPLGATLGGAPDVDFSLANLVLATGSEKNFQYSFDLTNGGTSPIQGYSMKLTFSTDNTLDAGDDFFIVVPLKNDASQAIGANQTLQKNVVYTASSPVQYLPVGSWYIFAEINYDRVVTETNYTNNSVWSTNKITVNNYVISFTTPPTTSSITEDSFVLQATFEPDMTRIYYRVVVNGSQAPSQNTLLSSSGLFPWETEVTISGLGPAFEYDVYVMGEFYDQKVTAIYKLDVKTLGTSTPSLTLSHSEMILAPTSISGNSPASIYSITGFHLTSNVTVTATGNFKISKDDVTYSNQLTYPIAALDQGNSQWVYVKFVSDGTAGVKTGTLGHATTGFAGKSVGVTVSVFNPTDDNFDGLSSLEQTGWTAYSVTGYHTWSLVDLAESSPQKRVAGNDKGIQIDGSLNGFTQNEDWLISPEVDLSGYLYDATVRFKSFSSGAGPGLVLKYSADYSGSGDPRLANWFDASADFPAANTNTWKKSSSVVPNKEPRIFFALVYTSTNSAGSRWTIDEWKITDNLLNIPSSTLSYQNVEVGTASEAKTLPIKIAGYGDVTVTVTEGFQVSLDNTTFGANVVVTGSQAANGKNIYVRFTPQEVAVDLKGTLTFSGSDLLVTRNILIGSSLLATAVGRPVESTAYIYPNPTSGPVQVDVSVLRHQQGMVPVTVTNRMGATVGQLTTSVESIAASLSDMLNGLPSGLYYITIYSEDTVYRNKIVKL